MMQVTICGQTFDIEKEIRIIDRSDFTYFKTIIDNKDFFFKVNFENFVFDTLFDHDKNAVEEIAKFDIRLELYSMIRNVDISDVSSGKRLDLLPEFVQEFGVECVNLEVQDLHSELVMEAMKCYRGG